MLALCDKTRDCYICVALTEMSLQGCGETVLALWNKTEDCYLCSRAAPALEKGIRLVKRARLLDQIRYIYTVCKIMVGSCPSYGGWSHSKRHPLR